MSGEAPGGTVCEEDAMAVSPTQTYATPNHLFSIVEALRLVEGPGLSLESVQPHCNQLLMWLTEMAVLLKAAAPTSWISAVRMFDPAAPNTMFIDLPSAAAEARVRALALSVLQFLEMRVEALPRNADLILLDAVGEAAWRHGFHFCVGAGALDCGVFVEDDP